MSKTTGWILKETLYTGGEGSDGAVVICFSMKKKGLFQYLCSHYLFEDTLDKDDAAVPSPVPGWSISNYQEHITTTADEAIKRLKAGVQVGLRHQWGVNSLVIEKCNVV